MTALPIDLARLAPMLFVVLWSTGFIGARYAMPWVEPFTFLSVRMVISGALIYALCLWFRAPRLDARTAVHSAIAGVLMHAVYLGAVFWSIRQGMPAGLSALIVGLQPIITAFIAIPVLGEKVTPRHWLGLLIGFVGIFTVLWPKINTLNSSITAATLAASFLSVLGMSLGTIWQKKFVRTANLLKGTFWQYLGGGLATCAMAVAIETQNYRLNREVIFAMAWLVLVLSIGAIFLLMYLIRNGAISKVASLFYLVPACTALIAWLLFKEQLSPIQILGMAATSLGVALATIRPTSPAPVSRESA